MAVISEPLPDCPRCGSAQTRIAEDVSDEVTILACDACATTWAVRSDGGAHP